MKKQLFLGSALLLSLGAFSQASRLAKPSGIVKMSESHFGTQVLRNETTAPSNKPAINNPSNLNSGPLSSASSATFSSTFTEISGSMNVFGMLINNQKPLQFNDETDLVTFIQRKSPTYNPTPSSDGNSGTIVAMIGRNFGTNWDTTCIWADASNQGRYPNGGVYNPPGNTNPNNAYVVGSGPVVNSTWTGSWYASKLIGAAGSTAPGPDEQYFANTGSFGSATSPLMPKQDFPAFCFTSTDDGVVRTMASIVNDPNGTSNAAYAPRGAHIVKGTFNAGVFVWTADSLTPPVVTRTDGSKQLWGGRMMMAWNEQGTVGYAVLIGCRSGATNSNRGWQPIVYKTTNSGNSWVLTNGIDFNAPGYDKVLNSLYPVASNSNVASPFFDLSEGADCVVDKNNNLHIVSVVKSTYDLHQDSVDYTYQFNVGGEQMGWIFQNTAWPYVFDFTGDGVGTWSLTTVDSLGTEGPSDQSGGPGFNANPWANQSQANPVASGIRIQTSRSLDGQFILYTWAESDTSFTTNSLKWNEFPNVKARAWRACDGLVSPDEYAITSPASGFHIRVRERAYFHFVSPKCKTYNVTQTSAHFSLPITVSNNTQTDGGATVNNFYSNATVQFSFPNSASCISVGTPEKFATEASSSNVYPNPTSNSVNVSLKLNQASNVSIEVLNALGQVISTSKVNGQLGENIINVDLNDATPGVYFVKVKTGTSESTKKLVVE